MDHPVTGTFTIRTLTTPVNEAVKISNTTLEYLFSAKTNDVDCVIEAGDDTDFSVVDLDTHNLSEGNKPTARQLQEYAANLIPAPDASWATHGHGIKAIYTGPAHRERALTASLSAPGLFSVELLKRTRHPLSSRTDMPGAVCSTPIFSPLPTPTTFTFSAASAPKMQSIADKERIKEQALEKLGMTGPVQRFNHSFCPIDGSADSSATGCVVKGTIGLTCFRCQGKCKSAPGIKTPGFYPYSRVLNINPGVSKFKDLAWNWVHWKHAELILSHFYPNVSTSILREAYKLTLISTHPSEPVERTNLVFNKDANFIFTPTGWETETYDGEYKPVVLNNDACSGLAYCTTYTTVGKSAKLVKTAIPDQRFLAINNPIGYQPVVLRSGIDFSEDDGNTVVVMRKSKSPYPIEMPSTPLSKAETDAALERSFPQIDLTYLYALLAGAISASRSGSRPCFMAVTGASGSGKTLTTFLASSFLGETPYSKGIELEPEAILRQIGSATRSNKIITLDEVGKQGFSWLTGFYQISSTVTHRRLHSSDSVTIPLKSIIVMPCTTFPDELFNHDEFCRRVLVKKLTASETRWSETCGVADLNYWRDLNKENAFVANSVLAHAFQLAADTKFDAHKVAELCGFKYKNNLEDSAYDDETGVSSYVKLYNWVREEAKKENSPFFFPRGTPNFTRGFVDLSTVINTNPFPSGLMGIDEIAENVFAPFVPTGDKLGPNAIIQMFTTRMAGIPWTSRLKTSSKVKCAIRKHGAKYGLRFVEESPTPCVRGNELINDQLPEAGSAISTTTPTPTPTLQVIPEGL